MTETSDLYRHWRKLLFSDVLLWVGSWIIT